MCSRAAEGAAVVKGGLAVQRQWAGGRRGEVSVGGRVTEGFPVWWYRRGCWVCVAVRRGGPWGRD